MKCELSYSQGNKGPVNSHISKTPNSLNLLSITEALHCTGIL